MNTYLPLTSYQLCLPSVDLSDSEQAFGDAFLRAAQILHQHLEQIESAIGIIKDFTKEPFNMAILGLYSKMSSHYYSYVFLEIHHDRIGSKFLLENLSEAAITLIYLLEEVDKSLFSEYISASVQQAHYLLTDVEKQLQKFPTHPDLCILRDKLEAFISNEQHTAKHSLTTDSEYLWGPHEADTTAKRGAVIGLNLLSDPARQLALKVMPASWLDIQLSYLNSLDKNPTKAQPSINFTCLRDAAHLCLHATQTFLEEVSHHQDFKSADIERQQQILNVLYEWFYNAHDVYQLHICNNSRERRV